MPSTKWFNKYVGLPFKHLGTNVDTGIDCFNLCRHIIQEELGVQVPLKTSDFCNIVDDDWYNKTNESLLEKGANNNSDTFAWDKVIEPRPFDVIILSIGSTNIPNHCSLYVEDGKMLQIMDKHVSWVAPYGRYYKQYTTGIYRWKFLKN